MTKHIYRLGNSSNLWNQEKPPGRKRITILKTFLKTFFKTFTGLTLLTHLLKSRIGHASRMNLIDPPPPIESFSFWKSNRPVSEMSGSEESYPAWYRTHTDGQSNWQVSSPDCFLSTANHSQFNRSHGNVWRDGPGPEEFAFCRYTGRKLIRHVQWPQGKTGNSSLALDHTHPCWSQVANPHFFFFTAFSSDILFLMPEPNSICQQAHMQPRDLPANHSQCNRWFNQSQLLVLHMDLNGVLIAGHVGGWGLVVLSIHRQSFLSQPYQGRSVASQQRVVKVAQGHHLHVATEWNQSMTSEMFSKKYRWLIPLHMWPYLPKWVTWYFLLFWNFWSRVHSIDFSLK